METSYSIAYFLNKYLESGDEEILENVYKNCYGTSAYNIDDYNFIKELYKFNNTLDGKDKIKIVGIDIEHMIPVSYMYLEEVLNNENVSDKVKSYISCLNIDFKSLKDGHNMLNILEKVKDNSNNLLNEINKNQSLYKDILKNEFIGTRLVLENIIALCDYQLNYETGMTIREERIYNNFKVLDEKLEKGKYFGQWGGLHISDNMNKSYEENNLGIIDSFAMSLRKDEKYKNKVLSILYTYKDSKYMDNPTDTRGYSENTLNTVGEEFRPLTSGNSNCYIFDINKITLLTKKNHILIM